MEEKKFYRVMYKEYLAGGNKPYYSHSSRLYYGIPHIDLDDDTYSKCEKNGYEGYVKTLDYEQFKHAIKHHEIKSRDFEVRGCIFSKKEVIYKQDWYESWKVIPRRGPYYIQEYYIEVKEPSIGVLKEELSASDYICWCRDNGIELSEKAIISL